jgi:hypothetical protein
MNPIENLKEQKNVAFYEALAKEDTYELICIYSQALINLCKTPLITQKLTNTLLDTNLNLKELKDYGDIEKNNLGNIILLLYIFNSEKVSIWQKINGNKTYPIKPIVVKKTTLNHLSLKLKKIKHKSFNKDFILQNCTMNNLTFSNCQLFIGHNNFFENCKFKNCYFYNNFFNNNNFDKCFFNKTYTYLDENYAEYTLKRIEKENND